MGTIFSILGVFAVIHVATVKGHYSYFKDSLKMGEDNMLPYNAASILNAGLVGGTSIFFAVATNATVAFSIPAHFAGVEYWCVALCATVGITFASTSVTGNIMTHALVRGPTMAKCLAPDGDALKKYEEQFGTNF